MNLKQKVERYGYIPAEFDQVSGALLTENHPFAECRSGLDTLITTLRERE